MLMSLDGLLQLPDTVVSQSGREARLSRSNQKSASSFCQRDPETQEVIESLRKKHFQPQHMFVQETLVITLRDAAHLAMIKRQPQ
jgi:hypothetical protein